MSFYEPHNTPYGIKPFVIHFRTIKPSIVHFSNIYPFQQHQKLIFHLLQLKSFHYHLNHFHLVYFALICSISSSIILTDLLISLFWFNLSFIKLKSVYYIEMHKLCIPCHYSISVTHTLLNQLCE